MRRTKEEAEQTRARIAQCALQVFARRGYAATRLEEVADAAGVTRGAVYFHFQDKAGLFRGALEAPSVRLAQAMGAALLQEAPAVERLVGWFVAVLELAETDDEVRAALEVQWLRTEVIEAFADDMAAKKTRARDMVNSLAALVRGGQDEGVFDQGADPQAAATGLVSLLFGLLQGWLLDEDIPLGARGRDAVRIYLRGLARD